jgi:acyl dehydratase
MESANSVSPEVEATRTELDRPAELLELVGQKLGTSPWLEVTQSDVDDFARVTRDEQWIHVDRERAAAGPFGTTIAHGFFALSLCSYFGDATLLIRSQEMAINYGLDRVRFISPVPVGSRIRAHVELASAAEIENGVHFTQSVLIEIEGQERPACVAVQVARAHG